MSRQIRLASLVTAFVLLVGSGCSSNESIYHVRGKVTFKGAPVAAGWVVFTPDTTKQNTGVQGFAKIENGEFDTRLAPGMGTNGGAMLVKVDGYDGAVAEGMPLGKPIMAPYEVQLTLAQRPDAIDIAVPDSWASKKIPAAVP